MTIINYASTNVDLNRDYSVGSGAEANMTKINCYVNNYDTDTEPKSKTQELAQIPLEKIAKELNRIYKIKVLVYNNYNSFITNIKIANIGLRRPGKTNVIHITDSDTIRRVDNTSKLNKFLQDNVKEKIIYVDLSTNYHKQKILINKNIVKINPTNNNFDKFIIELNYTWRQSPHMNGDELLNDNKVFLKNKDSFDCNLYYSK